MLGQRPDPGRGAEERHPREPQPDTSAPAPPPTRPQASGGAKAWIPLAAAVVAMPIVALVVTNFVLVPRLQKALGGVTAAAPGESSKENRSADGEAKAGARTSDHQTVVLNKLLVNVAGTMGSRYLLTSMTLIGDNPEFEARIKQKDAQLRDIASGVLMTKTIADLEKPGARNVIRGELMAGFNNILGNCSIQEIYFTEFAIQ